MSAKNKKILYLGIAAFIFYYLWKMMMARKANGR